jgi:hypothetical protein
MSALVNANTRVGMGHTTRAQRSMLAAKESARQRHDDARAFLDPMKRNLHRNAWEERNAQRLDRRRREEEAAAVAKQEQEALEVEERRKRLEELYKKEQEAWAASPTKEPVEDDLERARKIDARRKEEQSEAREIARARLEAYRRAQTPEYRAAERLKQMHRHNEQRNQDLVEHASVPKAAAPCAVKTELVNDHFIPSEHKAPKCEVTVGFDDDGARTLSSGAKRRAFSRCCVEAFDTQKALTVEPLGLAVRVNQEGKPELAATLVITGDRSSIEGRVEAWASRVEAGEITVRGLRAKWVDSDAVLLARPPKHEAQSAYRKELQQAQEHKALRVEEEKAEERALELQTTSLFEPEKDDEDAAATQRREAKQRLDALERDAAELRERQAAEKAIRIAEERTELAELEAADRAKLEAERVAKAKRVEMERAYRLELARQTQLEEEMAQQQEELREEPSMAGLSWSERDARKERDRKASELLQAEIERDWQAKLAAKENRRPVTFNDAEKALREKLWNEHRARLQRTKELARRAHLNVQAENFRRAQDKREREERMRQERLAAAEGAPPVEFDHDLPPHLARKLHPSLRPATADADARRAAQARRDRHFSMAAGRPATADAQRSAATTWEPLATSQWKPTFPQY